MGAYRKFHGISLAANSVIENLHVERLDATPTELTYAGRVWYNTTTKTYNFTVADETDTIVVRSVATAEALAAEITALDGALRSYVDAEVAAIQSQVGSLGNAFNYVGTLPGQTGVTGSGTELDPFVLDAMEPGFTDPGDYYKIATAGFFKLGSNDAVQADVNDGLVFNTAGGLDRINNQQSEVAGTADEVVVTGSVETGFTVALAQAIKDSIAANAQAVADEAQARTTAQGDLQALTTDAKGNLVAALNEVLAGLNQEIVDRNDHANAAIQQAVEVGNNLSQEVQDRADADNAINLALSTETTNRINEDAELDSKIAELAAWAGVTGDLGTDSTASLDNLDTEAKDSLVEAINELKVGYDNLTVLSGDLETRAGRCLGVFQSDHELEDWFYEASYGDAPINVMEGDYFITEFSGNVLVSNDDTISVREGDRWYFTRSIIAGELPVHVAPNYTDRGEITVSALEALIANDEVTKGDRFIVTDDGAITHGPGWPAGVEANWVAVITDIYAPGDVGLYVGPNYIDRGEITVSALEGLIASDSVSQYDYFLMTDSGSVNHGPDMLTDVIAGEYVAIDQVNGPGTVYLDLHGSEPGTIVGEGHDGEPTHIDISSIALTTRGRLDELTENIGDMEELGAPDLVSAILAAMSAGVRITQPNEGASAKHMLVLDNGTDLDTALVEGAPIGPDPDAAILEAGQDVIATAGDNYWKLYTINAGGAAPTQRYDFGDNVAFITNIDGAAWLIQTVDGHAQLPIYIASDNYLHHFDSDDNYLADRLVAIENAISANSDAVSANVDAINQALTAEVQRAQQAEQANAQAIIDEAQARAAADGDLSALATTEKSNLVGAINEVAGLVGEGSSAIKAELDARINIYVADTPAVTHTFTHGFAGNEVSVEIWFSDMVDDGQGGTKEVWVNDSAPTHIDITAGTVTVYCDTPETVKIIVRDLSDMA